MTIEFEWDERKSQQTYENRALTFEDAKKLWDDPESIEIPAQLLGELRWAKIGMLKGIVHTAIFTIRGKRVRIISVRRSKTREKELYE